MQNSVLSTWITSLYGSQPSSVVFACKTETLGLELKVSLGRRPHLSFCAFKTACLPLKLLVSICPRQHLCIFANKSAWHTSPYVFLTSPMYLWMQNRVLSTRITSLYGSQPSSVVFACKTETLGPELQVSMGPRPHLSFCACKRAWLSPEFLVSMDPIPHLWFLCIPNSDFLTRITCLYGSQTSPVDLCMQNSVL